MNEEEESLSKKRADKSADNVTVTVDKSDIKKIETTDDPKPRIVLTFRSEKSNTKTSNMKIVTTEEKQEEVSPRRSSRTRGKWDWVCDSDASISPKKEKSQPVSETDESDSSHVATKRTRRRSKDENIIATAIARKEKSYNEATPGPTQRPSRRIKPTAKVLANEELRMGVESQNNARLGITTDKSPEEGVRTRRSARPPPSEDKNKSSAKTLSEPEPVPDVVEIDDDSQESDMKLQHLCKLGLKAIEVEEIDVKEDFEETEMLEDDEEEVDDDSEVISKLLEADEDTDDDEFLCTVSASSSGRQPRRSTRLCPSYLRNDSDRSSPVNDDDKSRSRRSSRRAAPNFEDNDGKSHRNPRKRKSYPEEVHSEADLEDESTLADGDEGSEAANLPEDTTVIASCLCETGSNVFADPDELKEPVFCQAIEVVDGVRVGCSHGAGAPVSRCLRRAGLRAPYFLPCALHAAQLDKHMCCPACGLFCTQGIFYQCSKGHLFHVECALPYNDSKSRPGCPHCGVYSYRWQPANTDCWKVNLQMHCSNKRIFLPDQREQCTPAYLGFSSPSSTEQPPIIPSDLLPPPAVLKRLSKKKEGVSCTPQELADAILAMEDIETLAAKIGGNINSRLVSECGGTCVHVCARAGHVAALFVLHAAGAHLDATDDNMKTPLIVATQALVAASEKEKQDDTKDMEVDQQSDIVKQENLIKVIRFLVAAGCDVNCTDQPEQLTALHYLSQHGCTSACEVLLSSDVAVDARDAGGWTPLVWAAENDHHHVVRMLLEAGASASSVDSEGNSSAVWCAASNAARTLPLLLKRDPHLVHLTNQNGDTPLHVAARQGHYSCVTILLAHGARCDVENCAGELPTDVCTGPCHTAISLNMQMKMVIKDKITPYKLLSSDIAKGRDMYPIPCINAVDDEPLPSDFTYVTSNVTPYPLNVDYTLQTLQGCSCEDDCTSSRCACVLLGVQSWWKNGRLVPTFPHHDPPMLFQCNPTCACNFKECSNNSISRLSRGGCTFVPCRVERVPAPVGWGLAAAARVPRGAPVALYTGELLPLDAADTRSDDTYMFALDVKPDLLQCKTGEEGASEGSTLCVDARRYGGAARFVNHSCAPNVAPLRLYTHTRDLRLPTVALFALTDIRPGEHFTFDYGDKFWSVKSKYMRCECGAPECRYPVKAKEETET